MEAMRKAIIEQERQRLLREHAAKLLGYLPKVCMVCVCYLCVCVCVCVRCVYFVSSHVCICIHVCTWNVRTGSHSHTGSTT